MPRQPHRAAVEALSARDGDFQRAAYASSTRSRIPRRPLPKSTRDRMPPPSSRASIASAPSLTRDAQPEVARAGVAHRVGDDLLQRAQRVLRHGGIGQREVGLDLDMELPAS